jgi:hypothetical protein
MKAKEMIFLDVGVGNNFLDKTINTKHKREEKSNRLYKNEKL